jgi:hypothetical protein
MKVAWFAKKKACGSMLEPLWSDPKLGHIPASLSIVYWPEMSTKSVIFIFFLGVTWLVSDEANRNVNVL